jgi:hypothetical protein
LNEPFILFLSFYWYLHSGSSQLSHIQSDLVNSGIKATELIHGHFHSYLSPVLLDFLHSQIRAIELLYGAMVHFFTHTTAPIYPFFFSKGVKSSQTAQKEFLGAHAEIT